MGDSTMASIGTGYDLSTTTFSPDGRVFQVEYAGKAVDNSGTVIGLKCKDGVVFAVEKMVKSKMLVPGSNRRIATVAGHVGMACAGFPADARQLVNRARSECESYSTQYGMDIPGNVLNERLSSFMHLYTVYWTVRPFGCSALMGVHNRDGYELNMEELSARDALFEVSKIIHQVHDEVKDKNFELELSWLCDETNGQHKLVPAEMRDEISARAKAAIEEEDDDDDDDDDEDED